QGSLRNAGTLSGEQCRAPSLGPGTGFDEQRRTLIVGGGLDRHRGGQAQTETPVGSGGEDHRCVHRPARGDLAQASELTERAAAIAGNGAGGRSSTRTLPPVALTVDRPRAHEGRDSRAASAGFLPPAPARAPASAAPSAIVAEYPTRSSCRAIPAAATSTGRPARSSSDACARRGGSAPGRIEARGGRDGRPGDTGPHPPHPDADANLALGAHPRVVTKTPGESTPGDDLGIAADVLRARTGASGVARGPERPARGDRLGGDQHARTERRQGRDQLHGGLPGPPVHRPPSSGRHGPKLGRGHTPGARGPIPLRYAYV